MFFILLSLVFFWLFGRELLRLKSQDKFGKQYMAVCLVLGLLALYPPIKHWQFEQMLTDITNQLAEKTHANVDCQSHIASIFDRSSISTIGYAYPETGEVTIKTYWCKRIKSYLKNPEQADRRERYSIVLLVHEAMHIRGELNESKTECDSIQRHVRAAKMLGVPEDIAVIHANMYFEKEFSRHPYFSARCKPGSEWDEQLADSIWEIKKRKTITASY